MAKRNRSRGTFAEERAFLAANKAADARSAGYRRGKKGQKPGGRYAYHPEFKKGYADGEKDRAVPHDRAVSYRIVVER
jgi:hypothetical protein